MRRRRKSFSVTPQSHRLSESNSTLFAYYSHCNLNEVACECYKRIFSGILPYRDSHLSGTWRNNTHCVMGGWSGPWIGFTSISKCLEAICHGKKMHNEKGFPALRTAKLLLHIWNFVPTTGAKSRCFAQNFKCSAEILQMSQPGNRFQHRCYNPQPTGRIKLTDISDMRNNTKDQLTWLLYIFWNR